MNFSIGSPISDEYLLNPLEDSPKISRSGLKNTSGRGVAESYCQPMDWPQGISHLGVLTCTSQAAADEDKP